MNEEEQLKLFDFDEEEQVYNDGLECNKCGITQPHANFTSIIYASGVIEYKRICKSCIKGHSAVIKTLKNQNAYPDKDYCCPICNKNEESSAGAGNSKNGAWVVDHDHHTEKFRGWLCHRCNRALGCFEDDIERIERAITYLRKANERT